MPDAMPQRRSIRLRDYDYSYAGAYFVTICTYQRAPILGWIIDGEAWLGSHGEAVVVCWQAIPEHYPMVEVDASVIMPNHVHGIIVIGDAGEGVASRPAEAGGTCPAPTVSATDRSRDGVPGADRGEVGRKPRLERPTLGHIVASFKAASAKAIRELELPMPKIVWQRGYYEHVIRSEAALARIRQYIADNPPKWEFDHDNPVNWK